MGETTDHFLTLAYQITDHPGARELDMLLSVGERISIALLAMAINAEGPYEAVSLTGSQVGIITDTNHTQAKIVEIRCGRIHQVLERGQIPIVAGFQGVSVEKEITTLGRGGSDTTAVALAAALRAKQCRILKDVDGIYTADPRHIADAQIIERLAYDQMLEFSATGSKVLATESVSLAREYNVEIAVGRSDTGAIGTIITSGDFTRGGIKGLVSHRNLIAIKLLNRKDLIPVLSDLHSKGLVIHGLHSDIRHPVLLLDRKGSDSTDLINRISQSSPWRQRTYRYSNVFARISAIGSGLEPGGSHFARLVSLVEDGRITPRWYCCSPTRVSFCIHDRQADQLLKRLHHVFIESASTAPSYA